MDASLIEKYVCPLFDPTTRDDWNLFGILRVVRAADQTSKQVRLRKAENEDRELVKYKVGQVIRHRRYNYVAVIVGWDVECGMDNEWITQNRVDSLARGRHQGFYHALYVILGSFALSRHEY
jgi:F-box protein 21